MNYYRNSGKKYRHSLEIVKDVLLIVSKKVRKTRIMYQANLSYRHNERYLKSLLENGLIECDNGSCYLITRKGKDFLQMYDEYLERHKRISEEISGVHKDRLLLENMCFNNEVNLKRMLTKKEVSI